MNRLVARPHLPPAALDPAHPRVPQCPRHLSCRRELVPGATAGIELASIDLADLSTVREWGQRALDFGLPLDLLVNNAGECSDFNDALHLVCIRWCGCPEVRPVCMRAA